MRKLLPVLLAVIGIGGGIGAGLMLRPAPPAAEAKAEGAAGAAHEGPVECIPVDEVEQLKAAVAPSAPEDREYVRLTNQFVVPVIEQGRVGAMVVLSLSVEVPLGEAETVFAREPKLRNVYLQVLFDHANVGGFDGAFTRAQTLDQLQNALTEASYHAVGDLVTDVLITEIARQDV